MTNMIARVESKLPHLQNLLYTCVKLQVSSINYNKRYSFTPH